MSPTGAPARTLFARHALLEQGWRADVRLEWNGAGDLIAVEAGAVAREDDEGADWVLPGMVNLHSHAFQRALAGLAETAGTGAGLGKSGPDSFWSWRALMYGVATRITPEQLEAIAAQLYVDCLRHGYTAVCEFHYLHRDPAGAPYARPALMAEHVLEAARASGIGITMLPVLYSFAGFDAQPLAGEQQRFRSGVDEVLAMVSALDAQRGGQVEVGAAPHSLRAAGADQIAELAAALPGRPLHLHIAEQQAEVAQCLAATGRRPLQYLMEQVTLDARWCLVHATHLDAGELAALAASAAVAGLCPSTEANLGDGLFALAPYLAAGGAFGIGSDSHVSHSPVEELRWLEYGQRLQLQRRNVALSARPDHADGEGESGVTGGGDLLWQQALRGGAAASGRAVGALAVGRRADLLVLDSEHPSLACVTPGQVLGTLVFCGSDNLIRHVMVGGRWVVRDARHHAQQAIAQRYRLTLAQLRNVQP